MTLKAGKICEKQHGTSDQTSFLFYQKLQKINATIAKKKYFMFLDEFPPQILSISCNFLKLNTFFFQKKILKIFCLILNDSPSFLELNFFGGVIFVLF